eukprot:g17501.t1
METLSDQTLAPGSGQVEAVAGTEGTDRVGSSEDLAARAVVAQIEAGERKGFLSVLKSLMLEKSTETQAAEVALAGLVIEDDLPQESPAAPENDSARMPGLFVMRRAFVAHDHRVALGCLALGLAFQKHLNPAGQLGDLTLLPGDDGRQILDGAVQMGQAFFDFDHIWVLVSGAGLWPRV